MKLMPDLNSLESVTRWHHVAEIGALVVLFLLAAVDIAAYSLGQRKETLIEREARLGVVRGSLMTPEGTPAQHVLVRVGDVPPVLSDERGNYEVNRVEPGMYRVSLEGDTLRLTVPQLQVLSGATAFLVDKALYPLQPLELQRGWQINHRTGIETTSIATDQGHGYALVHARGDGGSIDLVDLMQRTSLVVDASPGQAPHLAFSPSGQHGLVIASDGRVIAIDVRTHEKRVLSRSAAAVPVGKTPGPMFLSEERLLFMEHVDPEGYGSLTVGSLADASSRYLARNVWRDGWEISPDRTRVAYISRSEGDRFELHIVDVSGADDTLVAINVMRDRRPVMSDDARMLSYITNYDRALNSGTLAITTWDGTTTVVTQHAYWHRVEFDNALTQMLYVDRSKGRMEVNVFDLKTKQSRLIDANGTGDGFRFDSSGTRILSVAPTNDREATGTLVLSSSNGLRKTLVQHVTWNSVPMSAWSTEEHLAVITRNRELHVFTAGGDTVPLVVAGVQEVSFSADGRHLAFLSGADNGVGALQVLNFAQKELHTISPAVARFAWVGEDRIVYSEAADSEGGPLVSQRVAGPRGRHVISSNAAREFHLSPTTNDVLFLDRATPGAADSVARAFRVSTETTTTLVGSAKAARWVDDDVAVVARDGLTAPFEWANGTYVASIPR